MANQTLQSSKAISNILTSSGILSSDPVEICGTSASFFSSYIEQTPQGLPPNHQTVFLDDLQIPSFTNDAKQHLDSPLSTEELLKAITIVKNGETAGPLKCIKPSKKN